MQAHTFDPASRVWIYTSSRPLNEDETSSIETEIDQFCSGWTAHDQQLHAGGLILHRRLLILVVDETQAGASGCSIDKSAQFLRYLGEKYQTDFFTRNLVGLKQNGNWEWIDFREIPELLRSSQINAETPVLDVTASDYAGLKSIEKTLADSWLKRYLS